MKPYFWVKEDNFHHTLYTQDNEKVIEIAKFFTNNKHQDCYGIHFIYSQQPWIDDFTQFYCSEEEGIEEAKKRAIVKMSEHCSEKALMYQRILMNLSMLAHNIEKEEE